MEPPRLMRDDNAAEVGVTVELVPLVAVLVVAVELEAGAVEETITEVKGADVVVLVTEPVAVALVVDVETLLVVAVEEVVELVEVKVPFAMEKSPVLAKTLVILPMSTASSV